MQVNTSVYGQGINYSGKNFIKCADFNIPGATTDSSLATIEKAVDNGIITAKGELDKSIIMGEIGGGDLCNIKLMRYVNGVIKYQNIKFDSLPFLMLGGYNYLSDAFYSSGFNYVFDNNDLEYVSTESTYVPITFGQYPGNIGCNSAELQNSFITDFDYSKLVLSPFYRVVDDSHNGRYDDKGITELSFPITVKYVHAGLFYIDAQSKLQYIGSELLGWNLISLAVDQTINVDSLNFDSSQIRMINLSSSRRYRDNPHSSNAGGYYEYCTLWGCGSNSIGVNHQLFSNGKFTDGACICFGNDVTFHIDGTSIVNDGITLYNSQELQAFRERIYKNLAYTGLQFVRNQYATQNREVDKMSSNFCIPIWDKGVTTGGYTYGVQNAENDAYNWSNIRDNNYTPKQSEEDFGDFNSDINRGYVTSQGCTIYSMNPSEFSEFMRFINNYSTDEMQFQSDFLGTNPYDYISSALYYPMGVSEYTTYFSDVKLGHVKVKKEDDTVLRCIKLPSFNDTHISKTYKIDRFFNDFRDFEPYTLIELKLPFANTLQLDTKFWYGHTLQIKTIISVANGGCKYYILRDKYIVDIIPCVVGYPLPLTAANIGSLQRNLHSLNTQLNKNTLSTITDSVNVALGFTGNPLGMLTASTGIGGLVDDIINKNQLEYDIKHLTPQISQVSSIGDSTLQGDDIRANLVIKRAKTNSNYDEDIYIRTTGHANCITGKPGDYRGFIQATNAKIVCNLSAEERQLINNIMAGGFIIE